MSSGIFAGGIAVISAIGKTLAGAAKFEKQLKRVNTMLDKSTTEYIPPPQDEFEHQLIYTTEDKEMNPGIKDELLANFDFGENAPSASFAVIWDDNTSPINQPTQETTAPARSTSTIVLNPFSGLAANKLRVEGEYRPCPFCGCKELWRDMLTNQIKCEACGTTAPEERWNKRDRQTAADAILGIKSRPEKS